VGITDPETLTGWGIAVLLLLMLMLGWIQPSRTVRDKEALLQKQIDNLTKSVEYLTEANNILTRSVDRLSDLTGNTNEVVSAVTQRQSQ
jgi:hypothetical protein